MLLDGCSIRTVPHQAGGRPQLLHREPITREEPRPSQPAHRRLSRVDPHGEARLSRCDTETEHFHHRFHEANLAIRLTRAD